MNITVKHIYVTFFVEFLMSKEKKQVVFDADYLIFQVTEGKDTKVNFFQKRNKGFKGKEYKEPLGTYKKKLKKKIKDTMNMIAIQTASEPWGIEDEPLIIFSDPNSNFRYDIFADYKNRDGSKRSKLFYRLRKWAVKYYYFPKHFEADDLVSHYARQGCLVVSFDKDVYRSTEGVFFNPHHMHQCIVKTSKEDGRRFTLIQNVCGDGIDNIEGIKGVAETTAIKLLNKYGWDWNGVVKSYVNADKPHPTDKKQRVSLGLTEEDAILTRRLTDMNQLKVTKKGKYKLKLFDPKKDE